MAKRDLKRYRKKGPVRTTRILIEALTSNGIPGQTLLDIGGGVGAIQHEFLKAGLENATNVDASKAYIASAQEEAGRQGFADRVSYHHGDFVDLAPEIEEADIVTLDRVICCYDDMERLVGLSAERAGKLYGVVYPRDNWLMKVARPVINFVFWLKGNPFRMFVHPTQAVDTRIQESGLKPYFHRKTAIWQVVVYAR
ncbi:MAG: class I SAM-dependent methyltransferase [Candidatus Neomarinimicrobiota bacterium]